MTMPNVRRVIRETEHAGSRAVFYDVNAADAIEREETLDDMQQAMGKDA